MARMPQDSRKGRNMAGGADENQPPSPSRTRKAPAKAKGRSAEAHAERDARRQAKVYTFAGDAEHAAGDVNKLGKGEAPGTSRVRYIGTTEEFDVPNGLLGGADAGGDNEGQSEPQSEPAV
jgi:hypothetical protein